MKQKISIKLILTIILVTFSFTFMACGSSTAKEIQEQLKLANKYLNEQKYEEAILAFNKIIEIEPKHIEARLGLADAYIATERFEKAEEVLKEAIEIDKTRPEAYLKLVDLYQKVNKDINDIVQLIKEAYENTQDSRLKDMLDELIPQAPEVTTKGGKYKDAQNIEFMNLKEGEEVYYTLDDSKPTKNSSKYIQPINIGGGTTILRAIVVNEKGVVSEEIRDEYVVDMPKVAIEFEDKAFEQMIRKYLNKETGEIYNSDLEKIKKLEIVGNKLGSSSSGEGGSIVVLNDLKWFNNLEWLRIVFNKVNDINGLKGLSKLKFLDLSSNQISDITPIKGLTNLTQLYVQMNPINDISSIKGLTNLTRLVLCGNQISDISAIKELTNLTHLYLGWNQINDISSIKGLINLTWLDLKDNQISDISAIKGLINLTCLELKDNQISDISPLSNLYNLTQLTLDNNPIEDYTSLNNLKNTQINK